MGSAKGGRSKMAVDSSLGRGRMGSDTVGRSRMAVEASVGRGRMW